MNASSFVRAAFLGAVLVAGTAWASQIFHRSADDLFRTFEEAWKDQYTWQWMPRDTAEQRTALEDARVRSSEALVSIAGEFLAAFPDDSRKWMALDVLSRMSPVFSGPNANADRSTWKAFQEQTRERILNSAGVPDEVWERAMMGEITRNRLRVEFEQMQSGRADPAPWRAELDRLAGRRPMSPMLVAFEGQYAEFLLKTDPAAGEAFLNQHTASSNPRIAAMARGKLNLRALAHAPMELKFTATDGTEVDLAALRGSVVIIDFWATWGRRSQKEFQNIKAAYEAYGKYGVKMIGVSLDLTPRDPPGPDPRGCTKEQFVAEAAKLGMDWPQYYDGKGLDCEVSSGFDVQSPRMWVLDRKGMLKAQDVRGRKLWDLLAEYTGHTAPIPKAGMDAYNPA